MRDNLSDLQLQILDYVSSCNEAPSQKQILAQINRPEQSVKGAIRRLMFLGYLRRNGVYNRPTYTIIRGYK